MAQKIHAVIRIQKTISLHLLCAPHVKGSFVDIKRKSHALIRALNHLTSFHETAIPKVHLQTALTCTGNIFLQKITQLHREKKLKGLMGVISAAYILFLYTRINFSTEQIH